MGVNNCFWFKSVAHLVFGGVLGHCVFSITALTFLLLHVYQKDSAVQ